MSARRSTPSARRWAGVGGCRGWRGSAPWPCNRPAPEPAPTRSPTHPPLTSSTPPTPPPHPVPPHRQAEAAARAAKEMADLGLADKPAKKQPAPAADPAAGAKDGAAPAPAAKKGGK